jgi:peptide/nickel transport system substrate-binding protein
LRRDTSFYMLGWTPSTYDAHNALNALMACVDDKGAGQFNLGAYCNPKVDELTKKIQAETDKAKRNAMIKEAFDLHSADVGHLPLHQQALAWGVSKKVKLVQLADNYMPFKWMSKN